MKAVVISLGGSLIVPDSVDTKFLAGFRDMVRSVTDRRFVIVCGGGRTCRSYQAAAKDLGISDKNYLDWIGIASTGLNAELVRSLFGPLAYEKVLKNPEEYIQTGCKVLVGAGFLPGHSSDMDAVLLAKTFLASRVINISNIDYVYDGDPRKKPDARHYDALGWDEFEKIVGDVWVPGSNVPFDPVASRKARELGLKIAVLSGRDLENVRECILDRRFRGTLIS